MKPTSLVWRSAETPFVLSDNALHALGGICAPAQSERQGGGFTKSSPTNQHAVSRNRCDDALRRHWTVTKWNACVFCSRAKRHGTPNDHTPAADSAACWKRLWRDWRRFLFWRSRPARTPARCVLSATLARGALYSRITGRQQRSRSNWSYFG